MRGAVVVVTLALALFGAAAARAQVFSPGALSRAHAKLEGLDKCMSCHEPGQRLANDRCLACHTELKTRVARGSGFHGKLDRSTSCASCHKEHRGANARLIDWGGKQEHFNHVRAGFALEGAHAKASCKSCHEPRRITDAGVRKLLASQKGRDTFLGLPTRCSDCHFDEHRGQLGAKCQRCHDEKAFSPAPGFNHNKDSDFALTGRHRKVSCRGCHEALKDESTPAAAFPKPASLSFLQYDDVPHASCVECHKDPHDGERGVRCDRCHTTRGWRVLAAGAKDTGFHDKTRFPLRGGHVGVACRTCHGPFPGQAARYKGLPHARCDACHADAHGGQLEGEGERADCKSCHSERHFAPSLFDVEKHASTRYPLEGGHRAVPCRRCHDSGDKAARGGGLAEVPAKVRRELKRQKRPLLVSDFVLKLPRASERCESCHADPHQGQLDEHVKARGCNACHQPASFRETTFNHDTMSGYPLEGSHARARCARCHASERAPGGKGSVVRYKPVEQECAACHVDVHAGQLAGDKAGRTDCARCHQPTRFAEVRFSHDDARFTAFALVGRHREVSCAACHPSVELEPGLSSSWYRGVPVSCAGCHEDEHEGRFAGFEPDGSDVVTSASAKASAKDHVRCASCHDEEGFWPARFAHERTGFALQGAHAKADCRGCHDDGDYAKQVPVSCASCHQDVHGQQFGVTCRGCHDEDTWTPRFGVDAHRASRFPLSGRHAFLPCEECHRDRRDRGFTRAAVACVTCHAKDLVGGSRLLVDHRASRFGVSCASCHQPTSFAPASFPQHEQCFPLSFGVHRGVRCNECHAGASGLVSNGSCRTGTVTCVECHEHTRERTDPVHSDVAGYEHASNKCAGCHAR